jgi:hypothetical protein
MPFLILFVSFGICFCITWVLLHHYFYCFGHFQLPYLRESYYTALGEIKWKLCLSLHVLPFLYSVNKQTCIVFILRLFHDLVRHSFSLLSACVLCSSRRFSRDIEKYFGLSAAVTSEGSYDHIWFLVFRRISIVTKSEQRPSCPSIYPSVCRHVSAWVLFG